MENEIYINGTELNTFISNKQFKPIKPFIRWAGGKQNLVKEISMNIPQNFNVYFEPFLGAGSLFLQNNFENAVISDINPSLINAFKQIQIDPLAVYKCLKKNVDNFSSEYYYRLRDQFNIRINEESPDIAAAFIFLVHTSFNGIYRVNKKGQYNVPFGKTNPAFPSLEHLNLVSLKLQGVVIENSMYQDIINKIEKNDFVYFDPPYPPINQTSFFNQYSIQKFGDFQQEELAQISNELSQKGVNVMISNADLPFIRQLYKNWNIETIKTIRYINCKAERKQVTELIIKNY